MDAPLTKFIGGQPRHLSVTLDYPVEFEGTTYTEICLRRLTAGEVAAFAERARAEIAANPAASPRAPIFTDAAGHPIPDGLFDALDDDDAFTLDQAATDFLPRRFRAEMSQSASPPTDGSDTGPTS